MIDKSILDNYLPILLRLCGSCAPIIWRLAVGNNLKKHYLSEVALEQQLKLNIDYRINAANTFVDVISSLSISAFIILSQMIFDKLTRVSVIVFAIITFLITVLVSIGINEKIKRRSKELGMKRNFIYICTIFFLLIIEIARQYWADPEVPS